MDVLSLRLIDVIRTKEARLASEPRICHLWGVRNGEDFTITIGMFAELRFHIRKRKMVPN